MICAVVGDSIAVGIAWALPECNAHVKSAITSARYLQTKTISIAADRVVISLGANDWHLNTYGNLSRLRSSVAARVVIWIIPNIQRTGVRDAIRRIAAEWGDQLIDTEPFVGADHVHPTMTGYRRIAQMVRQARTVTKP